MYGLIQCYRLQYAAFAGHFVEYDEVLYLFDNFGWDGGLTHHWLAPAFNPVDGGRFFVSAVVSTNSQNLKLWKFLLQPGKSLFCALVTRERKNSTA